MKRNEDLLPTSAIPHCHGRHEIRFRHLCIRGRGGFNPGKLMGSLAVVQSLAGAYADILIIYPEIGEEL